MFDAGICRCIRSPHALVGGVNPKGTMSVCLISLDWGGRGRGALECHPAGDVFQDVVSEHAEDLAKQQYVFAMAHKQN